MTKGMYRPLAFVNARLLDPDTGRDEMGGLLCRDRQILDLGSHIKASELAVEFHRIDCGGHSLAPGLVDMRVQLREPGEEHKETIETATAAAAAGGITSLVCLPNTDPVLDSVPALEFIARRARETRSSKIYCYGALTRGLKGEDLAEIGLLAEAGAVGFTDGVAAIGNPRVMRRALSYAKAFDLLILQHPEDPELAAGGVMTAGAFASQLGLPGIPALAEAMQIQRDLLLVEATGCRYHASHITTRRAIDLIREAKLQGLPVSCDTAPPYFTLTEAAISDYRTHAKLSPPLRSEADRLAVIEGLSDGTIDAIASDHAPQDQDVKRVPFLHAAPGMIGLETLLPLSLALVHRGPLSLLALLRCLSSRPAKLLRLTAGRLAAGAPADVMLFDCEQVGTIDVSRFRSKSKNSLFDGHLIRGCVLMTVVDGRIVFRKEDTDAGSD